MSSTVEVVPSPVTSSYEKKHFLDYQISKEQQESKLTCAVDALAMSDAVGCWICISCRRTLPSLVILTSPAPDTSIFMVPLGPRLVFSTSWN